MRLFYWFRLTVGKPGLIPNKAQLVFESLIDSLKGLLEPILGKKAFDIAFPLLLGFFVFILINNWSGIFPGIGVFGFQEVIGDEKGPIKYWLRPGSSDLNSTLGLALIGMIAWAYICLRVSGAKFMIWELFGNKASKEETPKPIYLLLTPIFIGVGLIEMVSIAFRPCFFIISSLWKCLWGRESFDEHDSACSLGSPCSILFL